MLLDSSFSNNEKADWQLMYSKKMESFLMKFINYADNNIEVG